MKLFNQPFLILPIFIFGLCGCVQESKGELTIYPATFSEGQEWEYRTREGEEGSRVVIGRLDSVPGVGPTVHVKIEGLKIYNPNEVRGYTKTFYHVAIAREKFASSVIRKAPKEGNLFGFKRFYNEWLHSVEPGEVPVVYSLPISETVAALEERIASEDRESSGDQIPESQMSRIDIHYRSPAYVGLEGVVIRSEIELKRYLRNLSSNSQRAGLVFDLKDVNIDFTSQNLLLFFTSLGSGSIRMYAAKPEWKGVNAVVDMTVNVPEIGTHDLAFLGYAYKVNKSISKVIFTFNGSPERAVEFENTPNK